MFVDWRFFRRFLFVAMMPVVTAMISTIRKGLPGMATRCATRVSIWKSDQTGAANATAQALNERGLPSPRGGKWTARSVINVRVQLGNK